MLAQLNRCSYRQLTHAFNQAITAISATKATTTTHSSLLSSYSTLPLASTSTPTPSQSPSINVHTTSLTSLARQYTHNHALTTSHLFSIPIRNFSAQYDSRVEESNLEYLERQVERDPLNVNKVLRFYQEAYQFHQYDLIINRYESKRYAENNAITSEYIKACKAYGLTERSTDTLAQRLALQSMPRYGSKSSEDAYRNSNRMESPIIIGTPENPLFVKSTDTSSTKASIIRGLLMLIPFLIFLKLMSDQSGGLMGNKMLNKEINPVANVTTRFNDVKGCDEAKYELQEAVEFLKNPSKFNRLGGQLQKGVLLVGPPGSGKTLLARAVAGEAGVPFFHMSGSEFEEVFVGLGARRVRELFANARKAAPCVVFIDEVDAVAGARKQRDTGGTRMTLNQLLVELDGFLPTTNVIVIAATNFVESLDNAFTRAGRFDKQVTVPLPDVKGRTEIYDLYLKKIRVEKNIQSTVLARATPGVSGADIFNIVNSAAIRASIRGAKLVTMDDLEWAKDKVLMGAERKSMVMDDKDKKLTAYHEGGHALVALHTEGADPLHKATILPRGHALGVTFLLPEKDKLSVTKRQLLAQLDVCMGGRVAEELIFGADNVTTGAGSDMNQATKIARNMVMRYGMSDKIGLLGFDEHYAEHLSPQTQQIIDEEIRLLLQSSYGRAKNIILNKQHELHRIADALLKHETLSKDQILEAIRSN